MSWSAVIWAAVIAIATAAISIPVLIPLLRRMGAGQSIREEGPKEHMSKSGTPTMGGVAILLAVVVSVATTAGWDRRIALMLFWMLGYGTIGFADDMLILRRRQNLGLTARQKLVLQILVAGVGAVLHNRLVGGDTSMYIPLLRIHADLGVFYGPLIAFAAVAMANAVNLTDGLDGLASGITSIVAACLVVIGMGLGHFYGAVFSAAVFGACLGFLLYNRHPASLFMGDTGSLALGGALAGAAVSMDVALLLPLIGGVYVAEAVSVIVQVYVFQTQNGRRFFRMSPLHHHFELGGWSEDKVVAVFCGATLVLCALGVAAM
jgi:phospho-N-acetylmuramoyl-pentapeptide-transferase